MDPLEVVNEALRLNEERGKIAELVAQSLAARGVTVTRGYVMCVLTTLGLNTRNRRRVFLGQRSSVRGVG